MKKHKGLVLALFGSVLFSCSYNECEISEFLDQKEREYEEICIQKGTEVWQYYTDSAHSVNSLSTDRFMQFFYDDTLKEKINNWYKIRGKVRNDTLRRRIGIWNDIITCAQVNFESEVINHQSYLENILADYPSDQYTDQYIENEIVKLIKLRNQKARESGYGNYAHMVLQNTGIDTLWFENLVSFIDSSTSESYKEFVRKISLTGVSPGYSDIMGYVVKTYELRDLYQGMKFDKKRQMDKILNHIGIDINTSPIQYTFSSLPPGIGGFGNAISIPDDFKAVAREELSFYYLLHEIGHGLQWTGVEIEQPVLKGYEWCMGNSACLYNEAMAEVIATFSSSYKYLEEFGYTPQKIDSITDTILELRPLFLRYQIVNALFEIELYRNPEKPAELIKQELYRKYLFVEKDFSKKSNLISLSYVSYPVYEQNYLIADIVSTQIHGYLKRVYGDDYFLNPAVGTFLKASLWKSGELRDWRQRILQATNMDLYDNSFYE